jgi:hypothetical protein
MAVFAHAITQIGHQQSHILALRLQSSGYSGENLALPFLLATKFLIFLINIIQF